MKNERGSWCTDIDWFYIFLIVAFIVMGFEGCQERNHEYEIEMAKIDRGVTR